MKLKQVGMAEEAIVTGFATDRVCLMDPIEFMNRHNSDYDELENSL